MVNRAFGNLLRPQLVYYFMKVFCGSDQSSKLVPMQKLPNFVCYNRSAAVDQILSLITSGCES